MPEGLRLSSESAARAVARVTSSIDYEGVYPKAEDIRLAFFPSISTMRNLRLSSILTSGTDELMAATVSPRAFLTGTAMQ